MERVYESSSGNGPTSNGHMVLRHSPYQSFSKISLRWLDVRVFYVRVSKCETDDESTPTYLTLNHVPLNPDTLLEVNGVRTGIYSDGASTLLRRDRVDKKSEEATFVSTDSIRLTGSVKFEVFNKDALLLSGVLELCDSNGCTELSRDSGSMWSMNCESAIPSGTGFLKAKHGPGSASPTVEVYVAGSFSGSPIILTRTLQPRLRKKQMKGMLDSIPEYEGTEDQKEVTPFQIPDYLIHKPEGEEHSYMHSEVDYFDGEDGELSWFNAGVRVGVGIGLSICVGIGLGVGLLIQVKNVSRLCHAKPIVTVNGMFPGPTIYAREGDRLLINVTNSAHYNMSIHCTEGFPALSYQSFLNYTIGLGINQCATCLNGTQLTASFNNITFVMPQIGLLQPHYFDIKGVFTSDFPDHPPKPFNYTGAPLTANLGTTSGTRLSKIAFDSAVELVLQDTNLLIMIFFLQRCRN
ncbi:hypothetical protein V6N13_089893 [Hibiscus sabdariffa]|uniref:Plastocyanin-like domain-containing protein n=1 Tax=Hibiscus sabdariffa TaxID=183260 RepID=A0ABR2QIF1_9ROSI